MKNIIITLTSITVLSSPIFGQAYYAHDNSADQWFQFSSLADLASNQNGIAINKVSGFNSGTNTYLTDATGAIGLSTSASNFLRISDAGSGAFTQSGATANTGGWTHDDAFVFSNGLYYAHDNSANEWLSFSNLSDLATKANSTFVNTVSGFNSGTNTYLTDATGAIGLNTSASNFLRISDTGSGAFTQSGATANTGGWTHDDAFVFDPSATVVPEPSSTALLGLGALGLLVRRNR